MATTKITDLTAYTDPVNTDVLPIVDVTSDVTKKVSIANVMKNASLGTAALPGIAFDGDPNTGIYSPGADQVAVTTGGTQRLLIDSAGAVTIAGDLTVNGTTTNINTTNLVIEDKNIILGDVTTPTDVTADGGGITLKGTTDKTINWVDSTDAWTSSERFSYPLGSAAAPTLTFTGDANTGIYSPGADQVAISTNGTGRLFVDASGNVGVGSSSPDKWSDANVTQGTFKGALIGAVNIEGNRTTTSDVGRLAFWQATNRIAYIGAERAGADNSGALRFITTNAGSESERMRLDSSGRLGLGTSSPSNTLHVSGTASTPTVFERTGTTGVFVALKDSSSQTFIGNTNGVFSIQTPGSSYSDKLVVTSAGNVGIGTTSPTQRLQVTDGTLSNFYVAPGYASGSGTLLAVGGGEYLAFATNGLANERARIDSSGRLLVGTSSWYNIPDNRFGSNWSQGQQIKVTDNNGAYGGLAVISSSNTVNERVADIALCRQGHSSDYAALINGSTIGSVTFNGADGTKFVRAASINAAVDGTPGTNDMPGRLVFSVTRDGSASPTEAQRINNAGRAFFYAAGNGLTSASSTGAGTSDALFVGRRSATTTTDGTDVFIVYTNGNVQNTNGSYTTLSDQKLKENIVDASSQWDDLKAIQIRNWNFRAETGHETHRQIGPIAQELEQVCPGLVFDTPDRDKDGNETGEVTKGINQSILYMKAVKALQEAMERIEVLEQRLADAGIA
jgi:hypothetical protein